MSHQALRHNGISITKFFTILCRLFKEKNEKNAFKSFKNIS